MIIGQVLGENLYIIPLFLCFSLVIRLWSLSDHYLCQNCHTGLKELLMLHTHTHSWISGRIKSWTIWVFWKGSGGFLTEYHHIWWCQVQIPVWEVLLPGSKPSFTIMLMEVWFILPMLQITFLYCFYFLRGTQDLNRSCQPTICFQWQPRGRNIYNNCSEAQKWHIFQKYSPLIMKRGLNDKKVVCCFFFFPEKEWLLSFSELI